MSKLYNHIAVGDKVSWKTKNQPTSTGTVTKIRTHDNVKILMINRSDGIKIQIAANHVYLIK